jgi:hypothetical protein
MKSIFGGGRSRDPHTTCGNPLPMISAERSSGPKDRGYLRFKCSSAADLPLMNSDELGDHGVDLIRYFD